MSERQDPARAHSSAVPRLGDPLAAVLALGARRVRIGVMIGIAGGLLVHGAAASHGLSVSELLRLRNFAAIVRADVRARVATTFDIEKEPEPPPPEPEPTPEPEEPEEEEQEPLKAPDKAEDPNPPPPAAAEAAKIVTAESDPNAPLDLTGFTMVTGNADRSPGGLTAASGTSKRPVFDRTAQSDGVGASKQHVPQKPVAPKVDLSRKPGIAGGTSWANCPFPSEADLEQINYRRVELLITISESGTASEVVVLKNGDKGFGANARACAMRKRYAPALNTAGKPVPGTLRINVTFQR